MFKAKLIVRAFTECVFACMHISISVFAPEVTAKRPFCPRGELLGKHLGVNKTSSDNMLMGSIHYPLSSKQAPPHRRCFRSPTSPSGSNVAANIAWLISHQAPQFLPTSGPSLILPSDCVQSFKSANLKWAEIKLYCGDECTDQSRRLIVAATSTVVGLFSQFSVFGCMLWVNKQPDEQVAGIELQ